MIEAWWSRVGMAHPRAIDEQQSQGLGMPL